MPSSFRIFFVLGPASHGRTKVPSTPNSVRLRPIGVDRNLIVHVPNFLSASMLQDSQLEGLFDRAGTRAPVIYIHRISRPADFAVTKIYGYLDARRITHRAGPINVVAFGVEEFR